MMVTDVPQSIIGNYSRLLPACAESATHSESPLRPQDAFESDLKVTSSSLLQIPDYIHNAFWRPRRSMEMVVEPIWPCNALWWLLAMLHDVTMSIAFATHYTLGFDTGHDVPVGCIQECCTTLFWKPISLLHPKYKYIAKGYQFYTKLWKFWVGLIVYISVFAYTCMPCYYINKI